MLCITFLTQRDINSNQILLKKKKNQTLIVVEIPRTVSLNNILSFQIEFENFIFIVVDM